MSKKDTTLEKTKGGKTQLSKVDIQNKIRPHVPNLIEKALQIATKSKNDSNKLGAIKLLLAKVAPDLRAQEIEGELTVIGPVIYKPSKFKKVINERVEALPKTGDST